LTSGGFRIVSDTLVIYGKTVLFIIISLLLKFNDWLYKREPFYHHHHQIDG